MLRKSLLTLLVLTMVSALVLTACKKPEEKTGPSGAALSEVTIEVVKSPAEAVQLLQNGEIDIWAFKISDQQLYQTLISDDRLDFELAYGSYSEIRFNHMGPEFVDGRLNPFYDPQIREAMNWLVDRKYIVDEYLGGLGEPKWTFLGKKFPDSAIRYPHIIAEIEEHYAHNPEKAKEVVTERMEALGAELKDGKWHYKGKPVEIIGLIRADLPPYPEAGQYFSSLLEDLGFTVTELIRPSAEAAPVWQGSDPAEGQWSFYTGGWVSSAIPRDSAHSFDQFYTHRQMPLPPWTTLQDFLENDFPELNEASNRLRQKLFSTLEEREELFEIALWEAMKFSNQIWICDVAGAYPFRADVRVASDLAAGISDPSWVYTAHKVDENGNIIMGATMRMATNELFNDPYNPIAGSSFVYDMYATRKAIGDAGLLPDPRDGLYYPHRIKNAHVTVETGLPVGKTLDWLTLEFADKIEVPGDAWADWDAEKQQFITVAEKYPEGVTVKRKSVVVYPDNIFEHPLHDGSKLSLGDFVMAMIVYMDRGKPESAIYDKSYEPTLTADLTSLKGIRIVDTNPLTIETYSDMWYLDGESNVSSWWPEYGLYGWHGTWHSIAVGCLAEAAGELAFTKGKAEELGVDQMDYTKGESLQILKKHMDKAAEENYIPYKPTLGQYITEEEAAERWKNIQAFYEKYGHFWVGSGPYIIKSVHPIEKVIVLEGFEAYPDPVDKFHFFLEELPGME